MNTCIQVSYIIFYEFLKFKKYNYYIDKCKIKFTFYKKNQIKQL